MKKAFFAPLLLALPILFGGTVRAAVSSDDGTVTIAVLSVGDFHASFVRRDASGIPGAAALCNTVDSLKRVYPYHLTLSAGDNFGGSYYYNATRGALMPTLLDALGIRISAIGNHEFDDGQAALAARWQGTAPRPAGWDLRYLCANVREASTGRIPAFATPFAVEHITLPDGRKVSIAITGLITGSTPLQTSRSKVNGLTFDARYATVLDSVKRLPEFRPALEATARIVLTHIGSRTDADGRPEWEDDAATELALLTDTTWHAFISAHTHNRVSGRTGRGNYPLLQAGCYGRTVGVTKLRIDTTTMRVVDVSTELCPVRTDQPLDAKSLRLQAQIDSTLAVTRTRGGAPLQQHVTHLNRTLRHERGEEPKQTEVGTLVCRAYAEAYRRAAKLDRDDIIIGISHFGSIRTALPEGDISVLEVGDALPFANDLAVFHVDGRGLRRLVEYGLLHATHGRMQTAWLEVERTRRGGIGRMYYVGPSGRRQRIGDATHCTFVVDDFITNGGDGYPRECFPDDCRDRSIDLPATTDAFIQYLTEQ